MPYRRALVILVLVLLVVPFRPLAAAEESPQSVARLQNFGTLVSFLNLASGTVRLVVILEPAAEASTTALHALESLLQANASKRLRAYVVWTPVSAADTELRALSASNQLRDRRLVYFWDPQAFTANAFRDVLDAKDAPATGALLLYDTDARLALAPPAPSLWMSVNPQLEGPGLDTARLGSQANAMVRRVEAKVTDGAPSKN
jgi:hypothetical protein